MWFILNVMEAGESMHAFICSLCVVAAAAIASAQKPASTKADAQAIKTLTLTGCVEKGSTPNQFTVSDEHSGKYQVTGGRMGRYVGQRVEIAGISDPSKLKVKGGLWPSPNAAAQAGAMDPTRAAVAAQPAGPASGTGDVDLPTLAVKSVRALARGCR